MPLEVIWRTGQFNLCHGNGFEGEEAMQKVRGILSQFPQCVGFGEDVCRFFGSDLMISTYPEAGMAALVTYAEDFGGFKDKVHIRLGLNSDRVAESLIHELLHADLLRHGFPRFDGVSGEQYVTFNYVQHELMFPQYQEFGLERRNFLGPVDVLGKAKVSEYLNDDRADFAFWCRQWCFDYQYANLTGDDKYIKWMATDWARVESKFPKITKTIEMIEGWLERGDYREPQAFEATYGELVSLMELPPIPWENWFRLKAGDHHPIRRWNK